MLSSSSALTAVSSSLQASLQGGNSGRSLSSPGETFGMDPLARRGNKKPPAGKGRPFSWGEAPGRGADVDRGRKASHSYGLPFPCQPCSICWQEQRGAAAVCPPGPSPFCPPPQPRFPPCLHFICHKCRGRDEHSLPQSQERERPLFLDPCFPMNLPLF